LLSRLPFLNEGYGAEEDSWGMVLAAQNVSESGHYEVSRLPGHPFQEFIYLLNPEGSYFYYNFLSAAFSAIAVLFFALILKTLGVKKYIIGSLALAFTPIFYVSSCYTIDYVWSLAFILVSFYSLINKKIILSGIFLGLAIGCRITSAAMLIPFLIILYERTACLQINFFNFLKISASALLIAVVLFIPIINKYGPGFFVFYDQFSYPSFSKIIYKATIGVFGLVGLLGIFYAKIIALKNKFKLCPLNLYSTQPNQKFIFALYVLFLIYIIAYLRLPQKSGYIIPLIPFLIILVAYYLNSKQFIFFCLSFIASSFIFGVNLTDNIRGSEYSHLAIKFNISGQEVFLDPITGPVISEHSKRKQKMDFTEKVISSTIDRKSKFVVISGWWYNEIEVKLKQKNLDIHSDKFVFYINKIEMENYNNLGFEIFYLPEQAGHNNEYSKINCTEIISKPFPL